MCEFIYESGLEILYEGDFKIDAEQHRALKALSAQVPQDAADPCGDVRIDPGNVRTAEITAHRYYRDLHVDQLWDEAVPCEGVKDDDSVEGGATPRLAYRSCRAGVLAEAMGNP